MKPPVLVLCLAFRHRKVRLYYSNKPYHRHFGPKVATDRRIEFWKDRRIFRFCIAGGAGASQEGGALRPMSAAIDAAAAGPSAAETTGKVSPGAVGGGAMQLDTPTATPTAEHQAAIPADTSRVQREQLRERLRQLDEQQRAVMEMQGRGAFPTGFGELEPVEGDGSSRTAEQQLYDTGVVDHVVRSGGGALIVMKGEEGGGGAASPGPSAAQAPRRTEDRPTHPRGGSNFGELEEVESLEGWGCGEPPVGPAGGEAAVEVSRVPRVPPARTVEQLCRAADDDDVALVKQLLRVRRDRTSRVLLPVGGSLLISCLGAGAQLLLPQLLLLLHVLIWRGRCGWLAEGGVGLRGGGLAPGDAVALRRQRGGGAGADRRRRQPRRRRSCRQHPSARGRAAGAT
eukprot:COSAG01_NODE_8556_length_2743_cov_8.364977_3_plen_399_part_00